MFEGRVKLPERTAKSFKGPKVGRCLAQLRNSKEARVLVAEKGHSDCFVEKRLLRGEEGARRVGGRGLLQVRDPGGTGQVGSSGGASSGQILGFF